MLYKENMFIYSPYLYAKFDSVINNLNHPMRSCQRVTLLSIPLNAQVHQQKLNCFVVGHQGKHSISKLFT